MPLESNRPLTGGGSPFGRLNPGLHTFPLYQHFITDNDESSWYNIYKHLFCHKQPALLNMKGKGRYLWQMWVVFPGFVMIVQILKTFPWDHYLEPPPPPPPIPLFPRPWEHCFDLLPLPLYLTEGILRLELNNF